MAAKKRSGSRYVITPQEAIEAGFCQALVAPKGHVISYHTSDRAARHDARSHGLSALGCIVKPIEALL